MKPPNPPLFALYRSALRLYPRRLRLLYQDQLLQTARDAHADSASSLYFWPSLFADLLKSAVKEHLLMIRDQAIAPHLLPRPYPGNHSHDVRRLRGRRFSWITPPRSQRAPGPDGRPLRLQDRLRRQTRRSHPPQLRRPGTQSRTLRHLLQRARRTLTATGYLNQAIPTPPSGVFHYLRSHPTDTITWQPQPNVRIAAVIHRVSGPHPGFLLTGRSLRLVEEQEAILRNMVFGGWFLIVFLLFAGAILLSRFQQPPARLVRGR